MDGLSAAASGIAVVSLAIQLIQATQDIRDFFKDFVGVPEEVQRLERDLVQLASILQDVQVVAEMQLAQSGAPNPRPSLLASLEACGEKLLLIQNVVDSAKEKLRRSGRVSRHWGSFKFVFKKKDIEKFETHLHQAMQALTVSMAMNLTILNLTGLVMINLTNTAHEPSRHLLTPTSSAQDPTVPRPISKQGCPELVKIRKTSALAEFSSYQDIGQKVWAVSVRKNARGSKFTNEEREGCLTKEYVLNISLTTLGYYISLVLRSSHWSISSGFRVDPVADGQDPIFMMCRRGDITGVQMAFSERKVSPFVRSQYGETLLHCAAYAARPKVVRLLLQCGVDAREKDHFGRAPLQLAAESPFGNGIPCIDVIRTLASHGQNDLMEQDDSGDSFFAYYCRRDSEPYIWVLHQEEFQVDILQAGSFAFHSIAKSFALSCYPSERTNFQSRGWELAVQKLLRVGVPLSPLIPGTETALDVLLDFPDYAVDCGPLADAWLSLLASVGVDIEEYVAREKDLHPSGFVNLTWAEDEEEEWTLKRLIFEKGESTCQRIRCEWYCSEESPIHLVFTEFSAFCYPETYAVMDWKHHWPFRPVQIQKNLRWPSSLHMKEREVYRSKVATIKARWARQAFRRYQRSQYSPRRIKPSRSEKRCRVPGAWVEDHFQTPYTFRYRRRSSLPWWLYLLALAITFLASRASLSPKVIS